MSNQISNEFKKYIYSSNGYNLFNNLLNSFEFPIMKYGRTMVTILLPALDTKGSSSIISNIVRTTTKQIYLAQKFSPTIYELIDNIKQITKMPNLEFNNGMIEIYDNSYSTMKYHTDQALDIKEDSYILLFSCYENTNNTQRILRIANKKQLNNTYELTLDNNSFVLFSTNTNSNHVHQIILDSNNLTGSSRWCGITLRLSKTFIKFINEKAYFNSGVLFGTELRLANANEANEFYRMKGEENRKIDYKYPVVPYTISASDLLKIKT